MRRTEQVELTNMCMIEKEDQVLVQDKIWREWHGVVFPGGHVEAHEPFVDSLIREIQEETGLTVEKPELMGIKDWINEDGSRYMVLLYKTRHFTGTLKSSHEGKVYWISKDQLKNENLMWNMEEIIEICTGKTYTEVFIDDDDNAILK